jgi:hypothetical protein
MVNVTMMFVNFLPECIRIIEAFIGYWRTNDLASNLLSMPRESMQMINVKIVNLMC